MKIFNSLSELIGNTPLMKLNGYMNKKELKASVFAKLESFNPAGSAKDRIADKMIREAEKSGLLKAGSVIIEPTSGNTGIGLAAIAAAKGYKAIIVMPDTMSVERINIMRAYGAQVVLTPGVKGMAGTIEKAEELRSQTPGAFIPGQFTNTDNYAAHYETTGPEIWRDLEGNVDIFVAGVGTGGTITGIGRYLKEQNPDIKIVAVEPKASPLLSKGVAGPHPIQGIGANFVPEILDTKIYDEIIAVSGEDSYKTAQELVKAEGVLCGISSGAALFAATLLAKHPENEGKNIVVLMPDGGERYLTTPGFIAE